MACVEQARTAERTGQYALARRLYERALHLLADAETGPSPATLLRWVGNAHLDEGDGEAALDCYLASHAVAELNDDGQSIAHALNCMGIIHQIWGKLDEADSYYRDAGALASEAGELRLQAMVFQNLGAVANTRGDLPRALEYYQLSLERYRELRDEQYIGQVLNNLGMILTDLEQWDEAEATFSESAALCEKVGDLRTRVLVECNRTELYIHRGELDRATASCDASFELASRIDYQLGLGEAYRNYGVIFREMGQLGLAEMHLRTAGEIAERYTNPLLAAEVQRELAEVYRGQDRNREALQALTYAHRVFEELRARRDLADVDRRIGELEELYLQVVRKWGESIESKDRYTAGHCQRVADYGCMLAKALGYDEQTLTWFRMGAFLHDVGKTIIPEEILNKEGQLTPEEWETMKRHTIVGVELLSTIEFPWDVRPMVRSHHERWDGTGYPDGLKERAIPLPARILCIADVYDALTTDRAYRAAYTPEEALEIMEADSGKIFDPELFPVFRRLIEERLRAERSEEE